MTFRGLLRGLGKTLTWGFISLAAIYGLLFAINLGDEELTTEAKSLLTVSQKKEIPDNGYLALMGINAPAGEDSYDYGKRWVDTFNTVTDRAAIEKAKAVFNESKPLFNGDTKQLCDPVKSPCLPQAAKNAELLHKLAAGNKLLIERQHRMIGYRNFEEIYIPTSMESPLPSYFSKRHLLLDLIALDAAEGRLEPALASLESLIAFDRRALHGARSLLLGLAASKWLRQDYALLAEIVASRPGSLAAQKDRLIRMTEPIDITQIRTVSGNLMDWEKRLIARSLSEGKAESVFSIIGIRTLGIAAPFFKKQASINLEARNHNAIQTRIRELNIEKPDEWIAGINRTEQDAFSATVHSWRVLYNPVGKAVFMGEGRIKYDGFVLGFANLIGVTRLARLQVELATDGKTVSDVPARISENKGLYDPRTGKPMGFDADKRQLYFRGYTLGGKTEDIRVGI